MKIIHIVSSLSKINFGIWNAAVFASDYIQSRYSIDYEVWVCGAPEKDFVHPIKGPVHFLGNERSAKRAARIIIAGQPLSSIVIAITHGCWLLPSRVGLHLKKRGCLWIHTPHGMLEEWSLQQNKWKKLVYYYLIEKRCLKKADAVRAVSKIEHVNLEKKTGRRIECVENGVRVSAYPVKEDDTLNTYLFMARLHEKKGIVPLVKAWELSMRDSKKNKLIIAGPDEGELKHITPYLEKSTTIRYVGAVYGVDKEEILGKSKYYVLPSFSEGFPTSVLEAMSFGLIPLISAGCNLPEVFDKQLGYQAEPDEKMLSSLFGQLKDKKYDNDLSQKNNQFISDHYSEEIIADKLMQLYRQVAGNLFK